MASGNKVKRQADAGVRDAIDSVMKNQKFKRMMIFGLRSLSDLCVPPTIKYKENSMAVLDSDGLPVLLTASANFAGDEEVTLLIGKVFFGVSEALKDEHPSVCADLEVKGFSKAVATALEAGITDEQSLVFHLDTMKNLSGLGVDFDMVPMAPGLLAALNPRMKSPIAKRVLQALEEVSKKPQGAEVMGTNAGIEKILGSVAKRIDSPQAVVAALNACKNIAGCSTKSASGHLDLVIQVMEANKDKAQIQSAGSAALGAMVSPDDLKRCLGTLKNSAAEGPERANALTTLSSMSYISSCAEQIVQAGGIPLLIEAISQSAEQIRGGSKDPRTVKGLVGAAKMLASVGKGSKQKEEIAKHGGIKAIINALIVSQPLPAAHAACADALNPLLSVEAITKEACASKAVECLIGSMKKYNTNPEILSAAMGGLAMASMHESQRSELLREGCVNALAENCRAACVAENAVFHGHCIELARNLASQADFVRLEPMVEPLAFIINKQASSIEVAHGGMEILSRLAAIDGAAGKMSGGPAVEAAMSVMLEHSDSTPTIAKKARDVLDLLASEKDVVRTLNELDMSINGARTQPARCLRCLAAVNGLSQVARLKGMFEKKNASAVIIKGMVKWIEGTKFNDQQRIIKAGCHCVEALALGSNEPLEGLLLDLAGVIHTPGLKALRERQGDAVDNSLIDLCLVFEHLCATQRITDLTAAGTLVDQILHIMRKYPDARRAQVSCITSLNHLATCNKDIALKVVESGALRSVIAYMNKVAMYEDVQTAGCCLMHTLAKSNDRIIENLRASDALNVVRNASRTHRKSAELNRYSTALINMLVPEGETEKIIYENMREIEAAISSGNHETVIRCLKEINGVTLNPESAKIAARCDLGRTVGAIAKNLSPKLGKNEAALVNAELAYTVRNLTNKAVGVANLLKHGGVGHLVDIFESLKDTGDREAQKATLTATQRLLQKERNQTDICFKKGFVSKICLFAETAENDDELFIEVAKTLSAMKKSKELVQNQDFRRYIANLCEKLNGDGNREKKWPLIEALEGILYDPDEEIINIVVSNKGLQALYKVMDDFPDDWPMIRRSQNCVDKIAQLKDLRAIHKKMPEPAPLERVVRTTKKILRAGANEPDCAAMALRNLNRMVTPEDRKMLTEVGLVPEIEDLMAAHPQHEPLMKACADYLGKLGCDDYVNSLMRKIIDMCDKKPEKWQKNVTDLNNKLALYLVGELENKDKALALTGSCMDKLAEACKANSSNVPLLTSTVAVARRVARKSKDEPLATYGIPALKPKMMACLAEVLAKDGKDPAKRPRKLLIDGFSTLADIGRHPGSHQPLMQECQKFKTVAHANELLKHHEDDPEVVAAILDFLGAIGSQPTGAEMLVSELGVANSRRVGEPTLEDNIMSLLKRHRKDPRVAEAGYDLLSNLGANCKILPPKLKDPLFVGELNQMKDTPQMLAGNMKLHQKLINKEKPEETAAALMTAQNEYKVLLADPTVPDADKVLVGAALADFIGACAEGGLMKEVKKAGGVEGLIDMFENHPKDLDVLLRVLPALQKCAENDSDASAKIARNAVKAMSGDCAHTISGDFVASEQALLLLKAVAQDEGNGRVLAQMEGFTGLIAEMGSMDSGMKDHEAQELNVIAESLKQLVADDQPEHLTLEAVYKKWLAKKEQDGEKLCLSECSAVLQYWDFVSDYTEEYSKEPHKDMKSELGSEWKYGCLCYQLLHAAETNSRLCVEKNNEPNVFLKAMARQRNDQAAQCAVLVANDAVQWPQAVEVWANAANANAIVGEILSRGRKVPSISDGERELMLIPRMQLVERLAINRAYFNGTECMAALIGLWDDYDADKYSVELLKQVFKSMRKIVNDHWVGIILQNNVPKRLIDVVNDKSARLDLLPDVLFLLAALAVVPEIKTMIGELKGVEACLDLLVRSIKDPANTAAVQTNDCLALSAITLGHGANLHRFVTNKGLELNIQCMDQSLMGEKIEYDVANAASLLMCNTCFKRDEMKELYGKKGACQAVMRTINKYDGSEDDKAFRCLGTMFKAIGNLALYTPNVDIFMAGNIEKTFAHLYTKSDRLPDALMEASLRTLSNLAMENTETNMMRFGVTLPPILYMLKQGQRTSVPMFTLAFDVLGALCRLASNSKQFLKEDGILTCLKILNSYSDQYLYSNGIHVLGIQTTTPEAVSELIKHGVFDFLTSLLESQVAADEVNSDLAVSGLRCTRRLLKSQQNVNDFVHAGGLEQIRQIMQKPSDLSMLHMECHRAILNCLALFPPPTPPPVDNRTGGRNDDDWDGDVPDEGVLSAIESMERPLGPRSWECLEMDAAMISSLIESLCAVLTREENVKQNRLVRAALGLLAYFACEKVPGTLEAFYKARIGQTLKCAFEFSDGEGDIIKTGCYVINNVAYASEPELYLTLRKDREMRRQLDLMGQKVGGGAAKAFCDLTFKLLNEKSADPSRFEIHMQWNYPLELTWWDKDKYPMGVQDLPQEWKEELRLGGKLKTVVGEKEREVFHWRSSMDLMQLNWRVDAKEGPWQHSIGISRLCNIGKGLASETLRVANQQGSPTSKPREGECIVLRGLPCEEFPTGCEINIICGSKRARDKIFELFTEWREAAAFGF